MPQAPGTVPGLIPDVEPSLQGTQDVNLPVPVDAFGGAVGHALSDLGVDVAHGSDQIWQRAVDLQNLNNETSAKNADATTDKKMAIESADFLNKGGINAGPDALQQHIQRLDDIRKEGRQGLNPMAARMYDNSALSNMSSYIRYAARHSGEQIKVANNNASNSRVQIAKTNMGNNPTDDIAVNRNVRVIQSEVEAQGANNGWTRDQIEATKQKEVSEGVANRIVGLADNHGAIAAQQMLNNARKNNIIEPLTADRVQQTIDRKMAEQGSRSIADKVLAPYRAGEEDETEQEYIDRAEKEVDAVQNLSDDQRQMLADRTRTSIQIGYRAQKSVIRDQQWQDHQDLTKALDTPNQEGILPTTTDQLKSNDPKISAILDRAKPTDLRAVGNRLLANAMGKTVVPTPENQDRYHTLLGMAHDDPEQFMSTPLYNENIPKFQRDQLLQIQAKGARQAAADPRIIHAMTYLNNTGVLRSAGIDKKDDPTGYYNFVGALQDGISAQQHETAAKVSDEDIQQIANRLLQQKGISKGFLWDSTTGLYNTDVPDNDVERIKKDPFWARTNQQPTPQQIHNYYVREQYNKLFKGSVGTSKGPIVPGTVSAPVSQ